MKYKTEDIKFLEVTPKHSGWYFVTFFQYKKEDIEDPDYFKDWIYYNGIKWDYDLYSDNSYVCFIHKKE